MLRLIREAVKISAACTFIKPDTYVENLFKLFRIKKYYNFNVQ